MYKEIGTYLHMVVLVGVCAGTCSWQQVRACTGTSLSKFEVSVLVFAHENRCRYCLFVREQSKCVCKYLFLK